MGAWFNAVSLGLGIVALAYAVITNRQKAELQRLIKSVVADMERELGDIEDNVALAHGHVDGVRKYMSTLVRSEKLKSQLDLIAWAEADVTAAHRMLKNLRKDVASLQTTMFEGRASSAPARGTASD